MDDLTRIETDLETKRSAESTDAKKRAQLFLIEQAASWKSIVKLAERLESFKKSVGSRDPIHLGKC
jgi:hypothetical protein